MMNGITEEMLDSIIKKMKKVNMYIFCSRTQMLKILNYADRKNLNWNLLMWHKTNPIPACNNKYLNDTEYIVFMREKGVQVYGDYHTKKSYYISAVNKRDKKIYKHPTVKPLELIKTIIINSSKEDDNVLDCFSGSGTTCVAAKELNRKFIGIEINPEYQKTSLDRLKGVTADGQISFDTDLNKL